MCAKFLLICSVLILPYGHTAVLQATNCLHQFERALELAAQDSIWMFTKSSFISALDQINDSSTLEVLFEQLKKLEAHIKRDKLTADWHHWKLKYWLVMVDSNRNAGKTMTRFIIALQFLEENLLRDAFNHHWIEQRREKWLSDCNVLIDPLLQLSFYDDMFEEVEGVLNAFGYDSLKQFDNEATRVIYALQSVSLRVNDDLAKIGRIKITSGALEIISGILNFFSIILVNDSPRASLGLAIGGAAAGIGSQTADIVHHLLQDERAMLAVDCTNKVLGVTLALMHLIEQYANSADELEKLLAPLESQEIIKRFISVLPPVISLWRESKAFKKASRMWSYVKQLSSDPKTKTLATKEVLKLALPDLKGIIKKIVPEKELPSVFTKGATSFKDASIVYGYISPLVSVGFGIWDVILGANIIKSGPEIAQQYQNLATALISAKRNILLAFDIDADRTFEEGSLGTLYDASGRPEEWHRACFHGDTCMTVALLSHQVNAMESQMICRRNGLDLLAVRNKHISDIARGWLQQLQRSAWFSNRSTFAEYAHSNRRYGSKYCVYFSADHFYMAMSTDCFHAKKSAVVCG